MTKPNDNSQAAQPLGLPLNDQLGDAAPIMVRLKLGRVECRAWLEAEACADGLRLVGMGSRTEFDESGRLVSHVCEPTGLVAHWPEPERPGWIARILGA